MLECCESDWLRQYVSEHWPSDSNATTLGSAHNLPSDLLEKEAEEAKAAARKVRRAAKEELEEEEEEEETDGGVLLPDDEDISVMGQDEEERS